MTRVTRADGSVTTAEYDPAGCVQTLTNCDGTGAEVSTFSYTYDATGNIVTETVSMEGETAERSCGYTQRGELASVTKNGGITAYTYDAAGNRIKETGPDGTTAYAYDAADRLQSTTGARISAYTWFHEWWMENWQQPGMGSTDGTESTQPHDGTDGTQDEGMPSTDAQQNGAPGTGTGAPANGTASAETDPVRGIQRLISQTFAEQETYTLTAYNVVYYVNDLNRANSEVLTASTQEAEKAAQSPQAGTDDENYIYGAQRLYAEREESTETYLYDGRGSVVQLLQGSTVSQSYSYNAYGYINTDEYGIQAPFYGYNGEQYDPATGLQCLRARYYAPQNGSFTTQDSFAGLLTDALSQNRYTYVQNNPVNYIDPTGHVLQKNGNTTSKDDVTKSRSTTAKSRPTAPAKAASAVKNSVTSIPTVPAPSPVNYRKITYTSGAAKAAQSAKVKSPAATSRAAVASVVSNSYAPMTKAAGQTKLTSTVVIHSIAEASKLMRRTCSSSNSRLSNQRVLNFSGAISLSNEVVITEPDFLAFLADFLAQFYPELQELAQALPYAVLLLLLVEMTKGREFQHEIILERVQDTSVLVHTNLFWGVKYVNN